MALPSKWPTNNPVKWSDLLQAISKQQQIPEWPLLSKMITNLDCKTCGLQFVSSINYRRHLLTHSLTKDADKELAGNKDLIQKYWDSLRLNECKDIVSLKDVKIKGESGIAIFQQLESYIKKPKVILPQAYMEVGSSLIYVVKSKQAKRTTSDELFRILSDGSEQTFLCTVIDESVQTNVFEGDDKISQENLIACICFLLEGKLVDFWKRQRAAQELISDLEREEERQAKFLENKRNKRKQKKQKQKKKNEAKAQKQIVDHESESPEGSDEDASMGPNEKFASGPQPSDLDLSTQVAQQGQQSETSMPLYADKDADGGYALEEQSSNEEIKEDRVCADSSKKDDELEKKEEVVKDPPEETRQRQAKIKRGKGKKRWAKKFGNKSDTPLSTDLSSPDAAPANEESKTQAPPVRDVENEYGEGKLKEESKEQESKDKHSQVMIDTSTKVKEGDHSPDAVQVSDAGKDKDGDLKQKAGTAEEQKSEDVKNASELLHSRETSGSSAPSENPVDIQPDHLPSFPKPVVLSNAEETADAECSPKVPGTDDRLNGNLSGTVGVMDAEKEEDGSDKQKADRADRADEQKCEGASSSSALSENPIETPLSHTVLSDPNRQIIDQLHSPPDQQNSVLAASVGMHHGITEERVNGDFDKIESNEDSAAIAPLADDPDSIIKALKELDIAWELMLSKLFEVAQRQSSRHLTTQHQ